MSPLHLLTLLAAATAAAAAPAPATSRVCELIFRESDPSFDRITLSGTTQCRCQSATTASCEPLTAYPTAAPNSPAGLLNQFHRPSSSALQALLAYQIQLTCRSYGAQGRRCVLTWPSDGRGSPACDCAKSGGGEIRFQPPYFVDDVRSRGSSRREEGKAEQAEA